MQNMSFLIADSDSSTIESIKELIAEAFSDSQIFTSNNGKNAWEIVQSKRPSIIIADADLPGLSGLDLCKKVREGDKYSDIFFIILTEKGDRDNRIIALERGADDYLSKPVAAEDIVTRLISASRFITLQLRLKDENTLLVDLAGVLEQDIQDMISVCIKFLQARIPISKDILSKVASSSKWIAQELDFDDDQIREIEIASYLSYAGKMSLPDELLNMPILIDGLPSHQLMYQIPGVSREIVSSMTRFKDIADILYHLFENFDGSGFPDKLKKWQIPMMSRIIRTCLDYHEARFLGKQKSKALLKNFRIEQNRLYDGRVVTLLEQYLASTGETDENYKEKAIHLSQMKPGMFLTRDVFTNSGMKLISNYTKLTDKLIERIISHNTADPILGHIIVKISDQKS